MNPLFDMERLRGLFAGLAQTAPEAGVAPATAEANAATAPVVGGVLRGLWDLTDYPRKVLQGERQVFDPATGHVSDEATSWAADRALGRLLPQKVAAAPGEQVLGAAPIKAYHGSPHDFDRFDLSKIGTGEGAQAYGHGLYFAENEGVARNYRDALSNSQTVSTTTPRGQALYAVQNHGDDAARWLERQARSASHPVLQERYSEALNLVRSGDVKPGGRMYEVGIHADPERFLDWDKPLYQQTTPVRDVLEGLGLKTEPNGRWTVEPTKSGDKWTLRNVWGEASGSFKDRAAAEAKAAANTALHNQGGAQYAYGRLGGNTIYSRSGLDQGAASRTLNEAGIPGIRYLDQGSRGAGTGSRNYVVFSDDILEILRKYGLAGLGLGVPATMAMQPGSFPFPQQQRQPFGAPGAPVL